MTPTGIVLPEIVVTAFRDPIVIDSITFDWITTDGRQIVSYNPSRRIENPYLDLSDLTEVPGWLQRVVEVINRWRIDNGQPALNQAELVVLYELSVIQLIRYHSIILLGDNLGKVARYNTFIGEAVDNGFSNAIVHAFIAYRLSIEFGADFAKRITDAHEINEPPTSLSTRMDLANNQIGIDIAADRNSYFYSDFVYWARNGRFWTIRDGILNHYYFTPSGGGGRYEPEP